MGHPILLVRISLKNLDFWLMMRLEDDSDFWMFEDDRTIHWG